MTPLNQQLEDKRVFENKIFNIIDKLDGYIYCMVKNKDYLIAKKVKGGDFVKRKELKQAIKEAERQGLWK